jgi:hypothetical protein
MRANRTRRWRHALDLFRLSASALSSTSRTSSAKLQPRASREDGLKSIVVKRANVPDTERRSGDWVIKTTHGRIVDAERVKWNERYSRR